MKTLMFGILMFFCVVGNSQELKGKSSLAPSKENIAIAPLTSFDVQPIEIASHSEELALGCYCGAGGKLFVTPQWFGGDAYVRINGIVKKLKFDESYKKLKNGFSYSYSSSDVKVSLSCDQTNKKRSEPCGEGGCNQISTSCTMGIEFNKRTQEYKNLKGWCGC